MGIKGVNDQDAKNKGKNILLLIGGSLIGAGLLTAGFKFGTKYARLVIENGLNKCFVADPSLEEHMWNAIKKLAECEMNK